MVIKDTEVTISENEKSLGDNLNTAIGTIANDISELKSNVKWLYKYGGAGSGGGSSSSSSSTGSWSLIALFDGLTLKNGDTIRKSEAGTYTLSLSITGKGHKGLTYEYTVKQGTKTISAFNSSFNETSGYSISFDLDCLDNSSITIVVRDEEDLPPSNYPSDLGFNYVVNVFTLLTELYHNTTGVYLTDRLFYENVENDIFLNLKYTAAVAGTLTYQIRKFDESEYEEEKIVTIADTNNSAIQLDKILAYEDYAILKTMNSCTAYVKYSFIDIDGNLVYDNEIQSFPVSIIPKELYVSFTSDIDLLYSSTATTTKESYTGQKNIYFTVTMGLNQNRGKCCSLSYTIIYPNNTSENVSGSINNFEEDTLLGPIKISATYAGRYELLYLASMIYSAGTFTTSGSIYFEVKEGSISKEYLIIDSNNIHTNYKRGSEMNKDSIFASMGSEEYRMFKTSNPVSFYDTNLYLNFYDLFFNVSIKLDNTSSTEDPIIYISRIVEGNVLGENTIGIYQNKLVLGSYTETNGLEASESCDIYIPRDSEYHLVTVCRRYVRQRPSDSVTSQYELVVYIDGILEKGIKNAITGSLSYNRVTLCSENYSINLIELSVILTYNATLNKVIQSFSDLDVVHYYYVYRSMLAGEEALLASRLKGLEIIKNYFEYSNTTNMVKLTSLGAIKDISDAFDIQSLHITVDENEYHTDKISFEDWTSQTHDASEYYAKDYTLNTDRQQKGIDSYKVTNVEFSNTSISIPSNCLFVLDIQGTSTRANLSKNYNLTADSNNEDIVYVYSPNFNENDTTTFLPENEFTLKADFVDSGHSNNVACGKFINDVMPIYNTQSGSYSGHIKKCLDGFPVLLYVTTKTGTTYFMGIYSFNLGRGSHYNLGHKALSNLGTIPLGASVIAINKEDDSSFLPEFCVAEVLENRPEYDFSQYSSTILFLYGDTDADSTYMLGDIKTNDSASAKDNLLAFVKGVSATGAYLFSSAHKIFGPLSDEYHGSYGSSNLFLNQVPDYAVLYERSKLSQGEYTYYSVSSTPGVMYSPVQARKFVLGDSSTNPITPANIDLESVVKYYTICMAFGLVDSVKKNLNIKTWDGTTYHTAFYDMDTSFGINNQSGDVSYLAFSDFWTGNTATSGEVDYSAVNDNRNIVFRDYCPSNISEFYSGSSYDVPSSYLFAIAKYSYMLDNDLESYPEGLWQLWRSSTGKLLNVDYFIDTYYSALNNYPELIFNLNYRIKYFNNLSVASESVLYGDSMGSFHGRRLNLVKAWLNDRFKILDAYFYLNGESPHLYKNLLEYTKLETAPEVGKYYYTYNSSSLEYTRTYIGDDSWGIENQRISKFYKDENYILDLYEGVPYLDEEGYLAQEPTNDSTKAIKGDTNNVDIKYLHTIFTSDTFNTKGYSTSLNSAYSTKIKALDYSPLSILVGSSNQRRFMLTNSNVEYTIPISAGASALLISLYGSYYWTHLYDIYPFICQGNAFNINSDNIQYIEGSLGTISSFNITAPKLLTIKLNSRSYSGNLTFENTLSSVKFPNLLYIDIKNSNINLTCAGLGIISLNLAGVHATNINVSDCENLDRTNGIIYKDTTASSPSPIVCTNFNIYSVYENVNLTNQYITNLNLSALKTGLTATITESGIDESNRVLTTCTILNFETVSITKCSKLSTINITGENLKSLTITDSVATTISLKNCPNLETVIVNDNEKLVTLEIDKNAVGNISTLNISDTNVKTIYWISDDGNEGEEGTIDLTNATKLCLNVSTAFNCRNNSNILIIKFPNKPDDTYNSNNSSTTYLKDNRSNAVRIGTFINCTGLQRIYGNIIVTLKDAFGGCNNFSIHGSSITSVTFNNKSVVSSGKVLMPYEIQGGVNSKPASLFMTSPGSVSMDVIFLPTTTANKGNVTNMSFDLGTLYNYTFANTSTTLFDIYYFFSNCMPVSSYNIDSKTYSEQALYFTNTFSRYSNWTTYTNGGTSNKFLTYGIHRYLLHNVNYIAQFNGVFGGISSTEYYYPSLPSPTDSTSMDGFISPLVNKCTTFALLWQHNDWHTTVSTTLGYAIDRNFFINGFKNISILHNYTFLVKNINESSLSIYLSQTDSTAANQVSSYGNVKNLLSNWTTLTTLRDVHFVVLDFATINIPDNITTIDRAFDCKYGRGEFSIGYLDDEDNTDNINCIFGKDTLITTLSNSSFYTLRQLDSTNKVRTTITNNTLKYFKNITKFNNGLQAGSPSSTRSVIFGNALKYIDKDNFPYDVFTNCANCANLLDVSNFFEGVMPTLTDDGDYLDSDVWVSLPGTLFDKCTKVQNASFLFYNTKIHHTLNGGGFKNCTQLLYLEYAFADSSFIWDRYYTAEIYPKRTNTATSTPGKDIGYYGYHHGSIPTKFFLTANSSILNILGCFGNLNIKPYKNLNPTSEWDFDGVNGIDEKDTISTELKTITYTLNGLNINLTGTFNLEDTITIDKSNIAFIDTSSYTYSYKLYLNGEDVTNVDTYIPKIITEDYIVLKLEVIKTPTTSSISTSTYYTTNVDINNIYKYSKWDPARYRYINTTSSQSLLCDKKYFYQTYKGAEESQAEGTYPIGTDMLMYYCCPPDLFKYLKNAPNVTYLFSGCGANFEYLKLDYASTSFSPFFTQNSIDGSYNLGLEGRIPPYLLKPLENKSLSSTAGMFRRCKLLSYYCTDADIVEDVDTLTVTVNKIYAHTIPETFFDYCPNLVTLSYMFYDNIFSYAERIAGKLYNLSTGINTSYMFLDCTFVDYSGVDGGEDYKFVTGCIFNKAPGDISYMFGISGYYNYYRGDWNTTLGGIFPPLALFIKISDSFLKVKPSTSGSLVYGVFRNYNPAYIYYGNYGVLSKYLIENSNIKSDWGKELKGTANLGDLYFQTSGNVNQYKFDPYTTSHVDNTTE